MNVSRREMMAGAGVVVAGACLPGRVFAEEKYPWVGRFPIGAGGGLNILALTDLHFGNAGRAVDDWTIRDIEKMIALHQPELILVTGDAWFSMTCGRGLDLCRFFCETMSGLGLPWAYVRGNHDLAKEFDRCDELLSTAPGSLYRGRETNGNYRITVMDGDKPKWNFIFINDAAPELGFGPDEIAWLEAEAGRIKAEQAETAPAILFIHIPLLAFREMAHAGEAYGIQGEPVFCEQCDPRSMDAVAGTGIVKAVFCGHDHASDFEGTWKGVRLEYFRATGWAGYGAERLLKGATSLKLGPAGEIETATVFPNGRTWKPTRKVPALG